MRNIPLFAKRTIDDETGEHAVLFEWSLQPFREGWRLYRDLMLECRDDWDDSFLRSVAKHRPDIIAGIDILEDGSVFFTGKELPRVSRSSFRASMSRANRRYGGTGFTYEQWQAKLAEHNFCCANCGLYGGVDIDHIDPAGSNTIDNVQPGKGDRKPGRPKLDPSKKRRSHTGWYTDEEWRLLREYLAKLRAAEK